MTTQPIQSNFAPYHNPLGRYRRLGDLYLSPVINQSLSTYLIGNDNTTFYLTIWSINHFLSGMLFMKWFMYYFPEQTAQDYYFMGFVAHTLWEVLQIVIDNTELYTLRGQVDTVVDTLLFMLGMYVVYITSREQQFTHNKIERMI